MRMYEDRSAISPCKSERLKIIVVRHCETEENKGKIVQGHMPGRLSQTGRTHAQTIAALLDWSVINRVYSSDLQRALDTARLLLGKQATIKILQDFRIREKHFGILEGRPLGCLLREMKKQKASFDTFNPPGGESSASFHGRINSFINEMAEIHAGKTILIVTHFCVILSILRNFHSELSEREMIRYSQSNNPLILDIYSNIISNIELIK